ncbi:MAG: HIT family protein [Chitinispirillaceae bacterium]
MSESCVFCKIISGEFPAHIIYSDRHCLAFLDKRPLFPGHTLLVPKVHVSTLDQMNFSWSGHYFKVLCMLSGAVQKGMDSQGTFIAENNRVSQSVPHLHFHIVPRKRKDGLKGFFWPRHPYKNEEEMEVAAEKIRAVITAIQ